MLLRTTTLVGVMVCLALSACTSGAPTQSTETPLEPVEPAATVEGPISPTVEPPPIAEEPAAAGTYTAALPAADAEARLLTLVLATDGAAKLTTGYVGKGTVVESGSWTMDGNTVRVTLDVQDGTANENPVRLAFVIEDGNLVNTEWDESLYGQMGMGALYRQP